MQHYKWSRSLVWLPLLMLICLTGCGGFDAASAIKEANATNAQRLATLYVQYQQENRQRGPKDKAAFEAYIKQMNPELLKRIEVDPDQVETLFTSDRDGEPLMILYGVKGGNGRSKRKPIVFEKDGVDGVRLVAFTGYKLEEVKDDAEYDKLLAGK